MAFQYVDGRYLVGLTRDMEPPSGRVKLLIDDGPWYFDLRGVWARGPLTPCEPPAVAPGDRAWFELTPQKAVAWHYGRMRER